MRAGAVVAFAVAVCLPAKGLISFEEMIRRTQATAESHRQLGYIPGWVKRMKADRELEDEAFYIWWDMIKTPNLYAVFQVRPGVQLYRQPPAICPAQYGQFVQIVDKKVGIWQLITERDAHEHIRMRGEGDPTWAPSIMLFDIPLLKLKSIGQEDLKYSTKDGWIPYEIFEEWYE